MIRQTTPAAALIRRAFLDARVRTVVFACIFGVYAWLQAAGYRSTYPTLADRVAFAHTFAGNDAIRLLYGYPYDVLSVGGYSAWRVGGTLVIAAAAFGVLAAVRALRADEDSGRTEILLAAGVGRRGSFISSMAAIGMSTVVLWLAEFIGFVVGRLPTGGSAFLALATVSVVPVFAGIAAIACQLAPTRRIALGLSSAAVVLFWFLRVVADTWGGGAWLRWTTPLGWAEEMRPFAGTKAELVVLFIAAAVPTLAVAYRMFAGRDIGTGVLTAREERAPRLGFLSSPLAETFRIECTNLAMWGLGIAASSAFLGMISTTVSSAGISKNMQRDLAKFGAGSITTPVGYLSFVFIVFVLAVSLFVCSQVSAAREEEAEERLDGLLALPVSRPGWLGGRLVLASLAASVWSLLAGLLTWAGAASQGVHISLPRMLEAGANCLPTAVLFLGFAALAYSAIPRPSSAISYGLVGASFLWYVVGALAGVPKWLVDLTPFEHIGLVPTQAFRTSAAVAMVMIGLGAGAGALALFRRRDLLGA